MGLKMREKFDAYWLESNLVMIIGVVLDPRYKARLAEFRYKQLYGFSGYAGVYNIFFCFLIALFNAYDLHSSNAVENQFGSHSFVSSSSMMDSGNADESDPDYDEFMMQNSEFGVQKSDLEKYLEEPVLNKCSPKDEFMFVILSWWKLNAPKYPTLAKMTRDVLAVLVTSMASKSMLSAGGRVLKTHQTSLDPEVVEALLCLSDLLPDFFCTDMEVMKE